MEQMRQGTSRLARVTTSPHRNGMSGVWQVSQVAVLADSLRTACGQLTRAWCARGTGARQPSTS